MIVEINGKKYAFRFKHVQAATSTPRATLCEAVGDGASDMNGEPVETVLATATAKLSAGDNYCKNTGRKIALARCLASLKIRKTQRKEIWDKYFEMRGGKKV